MMERDGVSSEDLSELRGRGMSRRVRWKPRDRITRQGTVELHRSLGLRYRECGF